MAAKSQIFVIADDLSGAAELAGIAFAHGLTAEVQRGFDAASSAEVIAVDTDSRSLAAADTSRHVEAIADQIIGSKPAWIFKKVDSVLRGNVRVEIEAILRATGQSRAILAPANPTRGRTIASGRYFVDGVPLDQTAFANDPQHPRRSAEIAELLGSSFDASSAMVVPDVSSQPDLQRISREIEATTLAAGAADFFAALLAERCDPKTTSRASATPAIASPALLVCGSRNSWTVRQSECRAAGVPVITADDPISAMTPFSKLLLGIGETNQEQSQTKLLARLADGTAALMQCGQVKTLLAEGGATAAAIAARQGWRRLEVVATAPAGVGVLMPMADKSPLALIKPGSYSWPQQIWEAFCRCDKATLLNE
jgi:uncharacterized protein YgbK (DUF1537 family)